MYSHHVHNINSIWCLCNAHLPPNGYSCYTQALKNTLLTAQLSKDSSAVHLRFIYVGMEYSVDEACEWVREGRERREREEGRGRGGEGEGRGGGGRGGEGRGEGGREV